MILTSQFQLFPGTPVLIASANRNSIVLLHSLGGNVFIGGDNTVSPSNGFWLQGTDALGVAEIPLGRGDTLFATTDVVLGALISVLIAD